MRNSIRIYVPLIALSLILGLLGGYWYATLNANKLPDVWIEKQNISTKGENSGVLYLTEALFDSEICLPDIKSIRAKVKFICPPNAKPNLAAIGYVVSVEVDKLDKDKIPKKYLNEREEKYKAGTFIIQPLEEVIYDVHFEFVLVDKDGFQLAELRGPKHSLTSGKTNEFQDITQGHVSIEAAKRTVDVTPRMVVEKCVSGTKERAFINTTWEMSPKEVQRANNTNLIPPEWTLFNLPNQGKYVYPKVIRMERYKLLEQKERITLWGFETAVKYAFFDEKLFEYTVFLEGYNSSKMHKKITSALTEKYGTGVT